MDKENSFGYKGYIAESDFGEGELYFASTEPKIMYEWKDGKQTETIKGYKYLILAIDKKGDYVKFDSKLKELPQLFAKVKLTGFEGVIVNGNRYYRAKGIEVIE